MGLYNSNAAPHVVQGDVVYPVSVALVDGAITAKGGVVVVTKGSAAALTLAAPVSGTDDGKTLTLTTTTAFAHVVTSPVRGFNGKGASGTVTLAASKGGGVQLVAYAGDWYTVANVGATVA